MAHSPPPLHGPDAKRPKGILKNSNSYHRSPPNKPVTVVDPHEATTITNNNITATASENTPPAAVAAGASSSREGTPDQHLAERDIVLQNTLKNAGRRRSSSNMSRGGPGSRRHSHHESDDNGEASLRLKWDEANLYLTEQERTPKMKIDEPKTPFARGYDPHDDEAELHMIDTDEILVDELETRLKRRVTPDMNIPDLDIGEPEEITPPARLTRKESHSPKQVVVQEDIIDGHQHVPGDEPETPEEEEKHKKFEELRKKHYEMKNVANLLGHPEYLEEEDDDGDVELKDREDDDEEDEFPAATNGVPAVPNISGSFVNGEK
ncbi:hypothetical protein BDD12DRAFT_851215 [Trichophaea hybrida]|nr:hypothetical protein BDD12DRAFT_851215 [Trichophaea hybrida]